MWKRYLVHYFKRMWGMIYGIFFIPLFILGMVIPLCLKRFDTVLVFFEVWLFYMACFALWIFVSICLGLRLLRKQEAMLGVSFETATAVPLYPRSVLCLSDDWVCLSPRHIFHRQFITSVSVVIKKYRRNHNLYYCRMKCTDGKIRLVHVFSASDAKKIREWYKKGSV